MKALAQLSYTKLRPRLSEQAKRAIPRCLLAGAMGKAASVLLPFGPASVWGMESDGSGAADLSPRELLLLAFVPFQILRRTRYRLVVVIRFYVPVLN